MTAPSEPPGWFTGTHDVFYRRVFALAATALIGLVVYRILAPFLEPLAWAAILALFLYPLQRRLQARLGQRPNLAALLLTVLTLFIFTGPLTGLAIAFARQAEHLLSLTSGMVTKLRSGGPGSLSEVPFLNGILGWLDQHLSLSTVQVEQWVLGGISHLLQRLASFGGTAFFGAVGTVLSFTVMLFLLFFVLRDGEQMLQAALAAVPMRSDRKQQLARRMSDVTRAVVMGTVVTALVQGTLLGVGFAIAGLPAPVVFGVTGAILSVVPFGGTALVWVPGAAALFLSGHPGWGIFLALWGVLLVSSADNFLKPVLIGGKAEIPTLAVFIGVLGGLSAFGLVGMFTGPVVMALVLTLVRFASEVQAPPTGGHA
jgi:predicted PurR-regulated permease PerM